MGLTVIAVAASWGRRSLANPQEGMRVRRREMRTGPLPQEELQALGEPGEEQSCQDEGSRASRDGRRRPGDSTKHHESAPGHHPAAPGAAR